MNPTQWLDSTLKANVNHVSNGQAGEEKNEVIEIFRPSEFPSATELQGQTYREPVATFSVL